MTARPRINNTSAQWSPNGNWTLWLTVDNHELAPAIRRRWAENTLTVLSLLSTACLAFLSGQPLLAIPTVVFAVVALDRIRSLQRALMALYESQWGSLEPVHPVRPDEGYT